MAGKGKGREKGKGSFTKGKRRRGRNNKKGVSAEAWFRAVSSGVIDQAKELSRNVDPNVLYRGVSVVYLLSRHAAGHPLAAEGFPFRVCDKFVWVLQMFNYLLSLPKIDPNVLCCTKPGVKEKGVSEIEDDWVDIGEKSEGAIHALCRSKGQAGNRGCLKALVKHPKAEVNLRDSEGKTALHISCTLGVAENLSVLGGVHERLNFHVKDNDGVSGLEALSSIHQKHYPKALENLGLLRKGVFYFPPLFVDPSTYETKDSASEKRVSASDWLTSVFSLSLPSLPLFSYSSSSPPEPRQATTFSPSTFSTSSPVPIYDSPTLLKTLPKLQILDFSGIAPKTFPLSILELHPLCNPDDFLINISNFSPGDKIIYHSTRGSFSLLVKYLKGLPDSLLVLAGLDLTEDDVNVLIEEHPSTRTLILWQNPRLHRIPRSLVSLTNLEHVVIEPAALSVFEQQLIQENNAEEIRSYLCSLGRYSLEPIRERKCLVMGDTAVGKTTLVRLLRGRSVEKGEIMSTDGIDLGMLTLTPYKSTVNPIQLSIWDFAGMVASSYSFFLLFF